jgi:hypothetical protein
MSAFPKLNTGAVAQYPLGRRRRPSTRVLAFVDGSEQRFRLHRAAARAWTLRLGLLDEDELAALERFFAAQQGPAQTFTFTDPWTGEAVENCRMAEEELETVLRDPLRGETTLTIVEDVE